MKFSTLLLLGLASVAGCSSSTNDLDAGPDEVDARPSTADKDGGDDKEDAGDDSGKPKPGKDDAGPDKEDGGKSDGGGGDADTDAEAGLLTCEDEAIECGTILDDGAGNELDCSEEDGNPTGTEKSCESYETCEDNVCVCESQLELPEDERPECGIAVD